MILLKLNIFSARGTFSFKSRSCGLLLTGLHIGNFVQATVNVTVPQDLKMQKNTKSDFFFYFFSLDESHVGSHVIDMQFRQFPGPIPPSPYHFLSSLYYPYQKHV